MDISEFKQWLQMVIVAHVDYFVQVTMEENALVLSAYEKTMRVELETLREWTKLSVKDVAKEIMMYFTRGYTSAEWKDVEMREELARGLLAELFPDKSFMVQVSLKSVMTERWMDDALYITIGKNRFTFALNEFMMRFYDQYGQPRLKSFLEEMLERE